jgi:poly(3-hydroxybutyrate) depolymerase
VKVGAALWFLALALAAHGLTPGAAHAATATPEYEAEWRAICNATGREVGTPFAAGLNCRHAAVGGTDRRYVAWVPDAVAATSDPVPVVFMFHGSRGTGEQFLRISGWREVADAEGLIAVFPTGAKYKITGKRRLSTKWHSYDLACDVDENVTPLRNDVAFVDGILADVMASEQVAEERVYASGFSDGSQMAQRLAVDRGDRFAAVASSAGYVKECDSAPAADQVPTPSPNSAPSWANIGSLDDRALHEGMSELPMDPEAVNLYFAGSIRLTTGALGLGRDAWNTEEFVAWNGWVKTDPSWPDSQWTILHWTTSAGGAPPTEFVLSVLRGVQHHYPNATPGHNERSSAYVNIAQVFWIWLRTHTLA